MKGILFFILALVSAAPTPPTRNELVGKSWKVKATEKGIKEESDHSIETVSQILVNSTNFMASAELILPRIEEWLRGSEVVIQLLQSKTHSREGLEEVGVVFAVAGNFPFAEGDYVGKVSYNSTEV
jgi:hypothetical protein